MTGPLLSTMWGRQPRFEGDFSSFGTAARRLGFSGVEVSHSTRQGELATLTEATPIPVRVLHAPAPWMRSRAGRSNTSLNLAATDEGERVEAVVHHLRSIRWAARVGAGHVVVHLGHLSEPVPEVDELWRLTSEGAGDSEKAEGLRARARRRRWEAAEPHRAAARRSLAELAQAAREAGVAVGLENRLHFHELPDLAEAEQLLEAHPPELVGYWHDTGHAEVQRRLGLGEGHRALGVLGERVMGAHLNDVDGLRDHRAPGRGSADWAAVAAGLPPEAIRTLEVAPEEPPEALQEGLALLARHGVL